MSVPTLREVEGEVGRILRAEGGVGAILIDMGSLARVERGFGAAAYQSLHEQMEPILEDLRRTIRAEDLLAWDDRGADRILLFLSRQRSGEARLRMGDLRRLADRVEELLAPRLGRLTLPYLREKAALGVGYAFVVWSPLEGEERQLLRLIQDCEASQGLRRRLRERDRREELVEIIHNRELWTAFQPIVEITTRQVMGHEGLSRGPRGTDLESPGPLFGLAGRHGLVEELERACRRQAFVDWEVFAAPGRLFLNTVPATVRDPSFLGRGVLEYMGERLTPRLVTLEINERQVIENLSLYREAMHAFLDLGFTFAIDDVGAGYSGLETIALLGATYLKVDMSLVRHVHERGVNRQIIKAILEMAGGVGATVIAEGIESQEEADALIGLGVRYGQGYHFGRPADPYAPRPRAIASGR